MLIEDLLNLMVVDWLAKDFLGGADFIGKSYNHGFAVTWRYDIEWPHMLLNNICLDRRDGIIFGGIMERDAGVRVAVETMMWFVPIVEEIIV